MLDSFFHLRLIVEHGTFTEAARHAHLSQPALSASIQRLEEQFGMPLLYRGRRGATLSPAGEAMYPHVLATLAAVGDAQRAAKSIEGLESGSLRVAAGATACTYLLPRFIRRFRKKYPGVRFQLQELTTTESLEAIRQADVDLAIVGSSGSQSSSNPLPADSDLWIRENLLLIGAPSLDPKTASFLTFRRGSFTRTLFERAFPDVEVVMELGSIAAIKGHARAGIGLALISESAVREDLRRGRLVEIQHPKLPIRRELHLIHRGQKRLHPAAAALREILLAQPRR